MSDTQIFNYSINDGFLWSEVNLKGEKKYYIEGYASTIDQDKAGEIIDVSAQEDILAQIKAENITMDIEHEEWYDADGKVLARPKNEKIPVAKIISAELRPKGVWVKAEINTNLNSFGQVWGSIKDGFLKAFSIAFYPIEKMGSVIKHLNLVNVTLTGSPVNPHATFAVSMKSASAWMDSQIQAIKPVEPVIDIEIKSEEVNKMTEEVIAVPVAEIKAEVPVAEVKAEAPVVEPVIDIQAEVKAMKEAYEAEIKALKDDVVKLKADLAKPIMKAIVEEKMPKDEIVMNVVSPLQLVR